MIIAGFFTWKFCKKVDFEIRIGQFHRFSTKSVPNNSAIPLIVQNLISRKTVLSGDPLYFMIVSTYWCFGIWTCILKVFWQQLKSLKWVLEIKLLSYYARFGVFSVIQQPTNTYRAQYWFLRFRKCLGPLIYF